MNNLRMAKILILLFVGIFLILSFQNCGPSFKKVSSENPSMNPETENLIENTYSTLLRSVNPVTLTTNYGLTPYVYNNATSETTIDARESTFIVANSKNANPIESADCLSGSLPTNPYPIQLRDSNNLAFVGGLVLGQVPQGSDWEFTYCNSAIVGVWDSSNIIIDGLRASRGWDIFRFSDNSRNWTIKNTWVSQAHEMTVLKTIKGIQD